MSFSIITNIETFIRKMNSDELDEFNVALDSYTSGRWKYYYEYDFPHWTCEELQRASMFIRIIREEHAKAERAAMAARKTEHWRSRALFPNESLCEGCASFEGQCIPDEMMPLIVTEKIHGLRVYTRDTDPCPHECLLCGFCRICQDLTNPYEYDDIEADIDTDNINYWAFGNDDLGEYGCPKVEPVRNHKVKSKPQTVATSAPVKVKTKHPVKPKSSRRPHIRTHV